jgi:hypothetical protein
MKIYLSSTYRDLEAHRAAVAGVLRRMGHQALGMEDYVAEGARPLHRCLADVVACDAYVGILAWRYGHVPRDWGPGAPVPPSPGAGALPPGTMLGQTSITEFEYRQAAATPGKPVLMFLLDPEAEWPSSRFDAISGDGDEGRQIARLRQDVGQQHVVAHFRTPQDLASQVSAAVYRVEIDRQMGLDSLTVEARMNQPMVRNGPVLDSTLHEIKTIVTAPQQAQALQIDIGEGRDWWATRLYFLASLAADLTPIELIVFVDHDERLLGVVHPRIVKERLAGAYPALRDYEQLLAPGPVVADLAGEVARRANLWEGHMNFLGGEATTPVFVTRAELDRWLAPYIVTRGVESGAGEPAALRMQRLLDWPHRFVPLTEDGRFTRVVDRQGLAEQIARMFVREQVSRATSMSR